MLDIKLFREQPELVKENVKKKDQLAKLPLVDKIIELDKKWRKMKADVDALRGSRNNVSKEISEYKKAGKDVHEVMERAKKIPAEIEKVEKEMLEIEAEIDVNIRKIPNIIWKDVPQGKDASGNVEFRKGGKIPKFDFEIKNHVDIAEDLDIADFDASARSSGNGFYYLKDELAILNQALIRFTIDFMIDKKYSYIEPPLMLREKEIFASMDKAAIEQSVYSIKDEDLHLIGTSEQSVLAMHSGDTIEEWNLPRKYFSYSMCFRKEVGAHGINDKGLWRTHQFNKVEQFIFCKPEESEKMYDELMGNSEEILKALELPYRIIEICTGDLADWKYRSADFEVYRPTTKEYGEVMSLSNCTDYQARKLGIKCLDKQGNKRVLHTLNNTALATSRIMVCILENLQTKEGGVKIPKVLWKYTGFKEIKPKKLVKNKEKSNKK